MRPSTSLSVWRASPKGLATACSSKKAPLKAAARSGSCREHALSGDHLNQPLAIGCAELLKVARRLWRARWRVAPNRAHATQLCTASEIAGLLPGTITRSQHWSGERGRRPVLTPCVTPFRLSDSDGEPNCQMREPFRLIQPLRRLPGNG